MSTRYSSGVKSAPRSGYNFLKDFNQRLMRTNVLSQTARETGKRAILPEFGVGEAFRGLFGMDLDEDDHLDPTFHSNLQERIKQTPLSDNPYVGTLGTDAAGNPYLFPDTKQERTGLRVDKTPLEAPWSPGADEAIPVETATPVTPVTETPISTTDKVDNFLSDKEQWLHKTRNSPAAKAKDSRGNPLWSEDERWAIQQKHRAWKEKMGR